MLLGRKLIRPLFYVIATVLSSGYCLSQNNIAVNTTGTAADASAGLDIDFTNKGLLIPRVSLTSTTDAATIAAPATGLMVYNTNASMTGGYIGFWYWSGAAWQYFNTGTACLLAGNTLSGTLPSSPSEFVGTLNVADWIISTSNVERMRITSGGAILATGNAATGVTPTSGAGTRMMWIPAKAAFRAGTITGTQWDDTNIGSYSFAGNYNSVAKGSYSLALGSTNTVTADYCFATGYNNNITSTALYAFATGSGNTLNDNYGSAFGLNNVLSSTATGAMVAGSTNTVVPTEGSVLGYNNNVTTGATAGFAAGSSNIENANEGAALGFSNTIGAAATGGFAAGSTNTVNGNYGDALGYNNTVVTGAASGFAAGSTNSVAENYCAALGYGNTISAGATAGFATGYNNTVTQNYGVAMGYGNTSSNAAAYAFGQNMTVSGAGSVGINLSSAATTVSQANSMAVVNGKLGIGTVTPVSDLQVNGSISVYRITKTNTYTVLTGDYYIGISLIAAKTFTLPSAVTVGAGKIYVFKDEAGNAATWNITIACNGAQKINGSATKVINTNYGCVKVISDGANWFIW